MRNQAIQPRQRGFTLVELMIALAVLALLAAMAWPSFQNAVQRSRRADAMSALSEIMQAQERWRANNPLYQATLNDLPGARAISHDGHYALELADVTANTYTARAQVRSGSPQTGDSACQTLQVVAAVGNFTYTPEACWAR
jgi:type IV pilus assembly protein PilE